MRASGVAASLAVLALVAGTSDAGPRKKKKKKDDEIVDISSVKDKLSVYTDGEGGYFATGSMQTDWLFYGDGKTMYQQRIVGSGSSGKGYEWSIWAPRVKTLQLAGLETKNDRLTVTCGVKDSRVLTQLEADKTKLFFAKATFYPPLWQRQTRFLARDDDGTYYFVDELREEYGGQGYRVFVGAAGTMKEMPMTNVVEDSGGFIFATKGGSLKIIADKKHDTAYWVKGGKKAELTVLEPTDNRYLIYRSLGIYGSLGTVCDDL